MPEKVILDCDNCGNVSTVSYNRDEVEEAEPVFCPFCGSEVIMVEEYDDEDDSWIDPGFDDEEWDE